MRLFIAIDPPEELQGRIFALQEKLADTKAAVRWVGSHNYHITIKFIGEVEPALMPEIQARLDRAAAEVPVFPLTVEGLDRFPDRGPARVIIAHVISPDQRITKLHRLIDSALGGIGLELDRRILVPHLTLGRVTSNHGLNRLLRLLAKHAFEPLGCFEAREAVLYQSTLTPEGSRYRVLQRSPLQVKTPAATPDNPVSGEAKKA